MHAVASLVNPALHAASDPSAAPSSALHTLTTGLARGDDAAWAQFHRDHGPGLFRYLLAQTRGDHDLASDALQHTYLRVARYARPCEIEAVFASWLRTVARSALNDCRRRRRSFWQRLRLHAADASTSPDHASPSQAAQDATLSLALDRALAQLDAGDRMLLEEKYLAGRDVRTLATQLSISPKAVESRLTRARAELRRLILDFIKTHEQP